MTIIRIIRIPVSFAQSGKVQKHESTFTGVEVSKELSGFVFIVDIVVIDEDICFNGLSQIFRLYVPGIKTLGKQTEKPVAEKSRQNEQDTKQHDDRRKCYGCLVSFLHTVDPP